ncbi:MAG: LLM class flavin-dependent oxidoreductase [archaeon]
MKAEFGIRLPVSGPLASAEPIRKIAQEADALGFDAICVHDHISVGQNEKYHFSAGVAESVEANEKKGLPVTNFYEAFNTLAYAAGLTKHVKLGPSALVLPWRSPALFARQCATLQELSSGRFVPALCIGRYPGSFEALGLPYLSRGRMFDESLELLKLLFTSDKKIDFKGKYFNCQVEPIYPKPKDMPIWIGGGNNQIVYERVAKYADGLHGNGTPQEMRKSLDRITEALVRFGRRGTTIKIGRQTFLCLAETNEEARRLTEYTLHMFYHAQQFDEIREKMVKETLSSSLIGDAAHVTETVQRYLDAGLTFSEMRLIGVHTLEEALEMMRLFADRIMSSFQ